MDHLVEEMDHLVEEMYQVADDISKKGNQGVGLPIPTFVIRCYFWVYDTAS